MGRAGGGSLFAAAVVALGCERAPTMPADAGGDVAQDAARDASDAAVCRSGRAWSPGMPAWVDRTEQWGLQGLSSNNFAVGDLDGDGWPDLIVNHGNAYDRTPGQVFFNVLRDGRRTLVDRTRATGLYRVRDSDADGRSVSYTTLGDVDNDGDLDVFTSPFMYLTDRTREALPDLPEVLRNDGHGVFTLTPEQQIEAPLRPLTTSAFFFDQDLDGRLDLAVGYWWRQPPFTQPFGQQPQLFRGDGGGGFRDVTFDVGMVLDVTAASVRAGTNVRPLFGLVPCDVNDDGRIDLVGAAYGRMYNELFLAEGGMFRETAVSAGVATDERRDYSDDESFRCYCMATPSAAGCAGLPAPRYRCPLRGWTPGQSDQPYNLGGNTFSYACEDVDNDGDFDLYESNIRHPDVGSASDPSELLVNDGPGERVHFTRPGREAQGLTPPIDLATTDEGGQHNAAFDFDNDGRMDLYLAGSPYPHNRGWMFHQRGEGTLRFESVPPTAGFDHACPNGSVLADFDHDGDLDLITGTYGCNDPSILPMGERPDWEPPTNQPVRFYENVSNEGNWLSVRLVGRGEGGANRQGLGARVRVVAGGRTQLRLVHASSQNAATEAEAFFGLGTACAVERVEVRWPNGELTVQRWEAVRANRRVELREGDAQVRYLE